MHISRHVKFIAFLALLLAGIRSLPTLDAQETRRYANSERVLLEALKNDPNDNSARYALALMQPPEARLTTLRAVLNQDSSHPLARLDIAETLLWGGRVASSQSEFVEHCKSARITDRSHGFRALEVLHQLEKRLDKENILTLYEEYWRAQVRNRIPAFERCYVFLPAKLDDLGSGHTAEVLRRERRYCTDHVHRDNAVRLLAEGSFSGAVVELERQFAVNPFIQDSYVAFADASKQEPAVREKLARYLKTYFEQEPDVSERCSVLYLVLASLSGWPIELRNLEGVRKECQSRTQPETP